MSIEELTARLGLLDEPSSGVPLYNLGARLSSTALRSGRVDLVAALIRKAQESRNRALVQLEGSQDELVLARHRLATLRELRIALMGSVDEASQKEKVQ